MSKNSVHLSSICDVRQDKLLCNCTVPYHIHKRYHRGFVYICNMYMYYVYYVCMCIKSIFDCMSSWPRFTLLSVSDECCSMTTEDCWCWCIWAFQQWAHNNIINIADPDVSEHFNSELVISMMLRLMLMFLSISKI